MERLRRLRQGVARREAPDLTPAGSGAPEGHPDPATASVADVQVIYGASVQTLALTGLTVAQARPVVETILAVQPRSPVLVNGNRVRDSYVIAQGDAPEFVHHAGEKGREGWICASTSQETRSSVARTEPGRSPHR